MNLTLRISLLIWMILLMGGFWVFRADAAWQGPTLNPPEGNVSAPINVSNVPQIKAGGLTITGAFIGGSTANIVGDFTVNTSKFIVSSASGDATIAGNLTATSGNTSLKNLTVKDSSGTKDLFKVDSALSQDEVRVGEDANTGGMFQAQSKGGPTVPAILGLKTSGYAGSAIITRNNDANNGALYAKNDAGSGIVAETEVVKYGAIVGKATKGSSDLDKAEEYSSGVRGETFNFSPSGIQAISGVLGVGSDLANYANNEVRSFGVVGAGGDISNPSAGTSPRITTGVFGKAGIINSSIPQAVTYGVYGESGAVTGSGTSWAGYFKGKVKITDELQTTSINNSFGAISTQSLTANIGDGIAIDVTKTGLLGNNDPAVRITGQNGGVARFGGTEGNASRPYSWIAKVSEDTNDATAVRNLVLAEDDTAFLAYNSADQCVELWVLDGVGSGLKAQWGGGVTACTDPCDSPSECKQIHPGKPSCAAYSMYDADGKCLRTEGLPYTLQCCTHTPPP